MQSQELFSTARRGLAALGAVCLALLAAPVLAVATTPAAAQEQFATQIAQAQDAGDVEVKRFQDWALRCRAAGDTEPRSCLLVQSLTTTDNDRLVFRIMVGRFGPERQLGAIMAVPVGIRLPPGLTLEIDDKGERTYPFEVCTPRSCQAQVRMTDELLSRFKAGLAGHVAFQEGTGREVTVDFSLKGFTAGFKELP